MCQWMLGFTPGLAQHSQVFSKLVYHAVKIFYLLALYDALVKEIYLVACPAKPLTLFKIFLVLLLKI
jgi:hypothetical protein